MNKLSKKVIMRHLHRANKLYANREPKAINELRNLYGGTHWFYYKLAQAGHLSKVDGKYTWSGGRLNKKSIRPILQGLRKHRAKIHEKYVARPVERTPRSVKVAEVALQNAIEEHITNSPPVNPTINVILREIESEINQHRSNGASQIHLENVVRLTRDMEKIMA